jgi:hypothetical protein
VQAPLGEIIFIGLLGLKIKMDKRIDVSRKIKF